MIIQAAGRFGCAHRYVVTATDDGDQWLFVCEACGHRTELLPLTGDTSFGQMVAFPAPWVGAKLGGAGVSGRPPQSPLIQSA